MTNTLGAHALGPAVVFGGAPGVAAGALRLSSLRLSSLRQRRFR